MLEGMLKPIGGKKHNHTENPEYQNQASCRPYPFWSKISVLFKFTLQQPTLQHPVTAIWFPSCLPIFGTTQASDL